MTPVPRSLALATDIDVLAAGRHVERRDGYIVVRSPSNPTFYWGNFLLFDEAPVAGDGPRWEALFDAEFGQDRVSRHRAFAWDRTDGEPGAVREEFGGRGYDVDESVGLVADRGRLAPHARENRDVEIRTLDPAADADEPLWKAVLELQIANREDVHDEDGYRAFSMARLADLRALLAARRGGWYVAIDPVSGDVAASCGIVVTDGRGRFQSVDTALAHRRQGICSRLVVEAAMHASTHHGAGRFVIVADADYHALGLYESLGFERLEHLYAACLNPRDRDL